MSNSALKDGRGAVLWVAHFCFNALATKKAFHEAGYSVSHMSRPEHGFSKSRFGVSVLNPIRVRTELRYLRDRIIIDRSKPTRSVRDASKRLAQNEIISVTAGAWEGARVAVVDVGGCALDLATGAPGLALMTGAALLPVITIRDDASGEIHVIVKERIDSAFWSQRPRHLGHVTGFRRRHRAVRQEVSDAVARLGEDSSGGAGKLGQPRVTARAKRSRL